MRDGVLRSILIDVWVLHGREVVGIELPVIQTHHLVIVH